MGIVAATAAYSEGEDWFEAVKAYIEKNIDFTIDFVQKNCPRIKVHKPEGTYLVWLDFSAFTNLSDVEISSKILNDAKVWLDRGTMFGSEGKYFQRINVATPRPIL